MPFPYGKDLLYQEDFMKKKFLFGLIALLSVSFIFFGCGDSGGSGSGGTVYTVTYDGNESDGGTVPVDGTPYAPDASVTVLGNPNGLTKAGFAFNGWNTLADGAGTNYLPGDSFNIDGNIVLYAKWVADSTTYTVTYDGNTSDGGSVPVDGTSYAVGAEVTVLDKGTLTKTGSVFAGWNTLANGSGTPYAAADTFDIYAATTLYAQWATPLSVTYNGNGETTGTAPTDSNEYASGDTVTVEGNTGPS
jgi:uncharacterized repeat protein (TIGR02543 family)